MLLACLALLSRAGVDSGRVVDFAVRTHYGDPFTGSCKAASGKWEKEKNLTVTGVSGSLCSPPCDSSNACPLDQPVGSTASKPTCALQAATPSGQKINYCVLECSPMSTDAQCGNHASCKSIQGVGVCTYDDGAPTPPPAPTPPSLPKECEANDNGDVTCAGNVSPDPGCENINQLCCASQLPDAFKQLLAYRANQPKPFKSLSFKCPGNFNGGDAKWASLFGSLLKNVTGLTQLSLDISSNPVAGDALITETVAAALGANPQLRNFSIFLYASGLSDFGASKLGTLLHTHIGPSASALYVDLTFNDKDDSDPKPVTANGLGALAKSIGKMQLLEDLTLLVGCDMQATIQGVGTVAVGLKPLESTLQRLKLGFGFIGATSSEKDASASVACLGKVLGGFQKLNSLDLDLDSDLNDNKEAVRALGLHLACLPVMKIQLPGFDSKTNCHCGLMVDTARGCLVPNQYYDSELGKDCFKCMPQANATSCPSA